VKDDSVTQFDKQQEPSVDLLRIPKEHKSAIIANSVADKIRNIITKKLKDLQTFMKLDQEIPDIKAKKESAMINGFLAFNRGMPYEAAINFYYAKKFADVLNLYNESYMLEENFGRAFARLSAKQKKKVLRGLYGID